MMGSVGHTAKVVFLLGAGASRHTGCPLMSEFLQHSWGLIKIPATHSGDKRIIETMWDIAEKLKDYLGCNQVDFMTFCRIADVADFARFSVFYSKGHQFYYEFIAPFIAATIELSTKLQVHEEELLPSAPYAALAEFCKQRNDRLIQGGIHPFAFAEMSDTIISMNYDIGIDYALWRAFRGVTYGFYRLDYRNRPLIPLLLKLHGSVNWATCYRCRERMCETFTFGTGNTPGRRSSERCIYEEAGYIRPSTALFNSKCQFCGARLLPSLAFPSSQQREAAQIIQPIWSWALDELRRASVLVIIGYSFPDYDYPIRDLLSLALGRRAPLWRMIFVNPSDDATERFRRWTEKEAPVRARYADLVVIKKPFEEALPDIESAL